MGSPTLGTTNLDEPPEGHLPPPLLIPDNAVRAPTQPGEVTPEPDILQTPHDWIFSTTLMSVTTEQAATLKEKLFEMGGRAEGSLAHGASIPGFQIHS